MSRDVPPELKKQIRAVLLSKDGVKITDFQRDFYKLLHQRIEYRRLGFPGLVDLLKEIPDVLKVQYCPDEKTHKLFGIQEPGTFTASFHKKNQGDQYRRSSDWSDVEEEMANSRPGRRNVAQPTRTVGDTQEMMPNLQGLFSLCLDKSHGLSEQEVENLFSRAGQVVHLNSTRRHFFIRYRTREEAKKGLFLGLKYDVRMAHEKAGQNSPQLPRPEKTTQSPMAEVARQSSAVSSSSSVEGEGIVLFFGNLPNWTDPRIRELVRDYPAQNIDVKRKRTGHCFMFVTLPTMQMAQDLISIYNRQDVGGHHLFVQLSDSHNHGPRESPESTPAVKTVIEQQQQQHTSSVQKTDTPEVHQNISSENKILENNLVPDLEELVVSSLHNQQTSSETGDISPLSRATLLSTPRSRSSSETSDSRQIEMNTDISPPVTRPSLMSTPNFPRAAPPCMYAMHPMPIPRPPQMAVVHPMRPGSQHRFLPRGYPPGVRAHQLPVIDPRRPPLLPTPPMVPNAVLGAEPKPPRQSPMYVERHDVLRETSKPVFININNFPYETLAVQLLLYFSSNMIRVCNVAIRRNTLGSITHAIAEFPNQAEAWKCLEQLDGSIFLGRPLNLTTGEGIEKRSIVCTVGKDTSRKVQVVATGKEKTEQMQFKVEIHQEVAPKGGAKARDAKQPAQKGDENEKYSPLLLSVRQKMCFDCWGCRTCHHNFAELPEKFKIVVTSVLNEKHFWGHLVWGDKHELVQLKSLMEKLNEPGIQILKPYKSGEVRCAAPYGEGESLEWYRCWVQTLHSGTNARVLYIDYGNVEIVPIKSLKSIPTNMWKLRPQAVLFSASNYDGDVTLLEYRQIVAELAVNSWCEQTNYNQKCKEDIVEVNIFEDEEN